MVTISEPLSDAVMDQVIAPLLIIQRVANGSALTSRAITTGHVSVFNVKGWGGPTGSDGIALCSCLKNSAAGYGRNPESPGVMVQTTTDFHPGGMV